MPQTAVFTKPIRKIALTDNARTVLEQRYLQPNETPERRFKEVAWAVAQAETSYRDKRYWYREFKRLLFSLSFLPNSPTIVNAGRTGTRSLSACFVVSPQDSLKSILKTQEDWGLIEQSGGGVGADFSAIRAKGSIINTTHGVALGPIAVMQMYSFNAAKLTQGAFRLGAHMAMLDASHPDIQEFIHCKDQDNTLANFNISVKITDAFMEAVKNNGHWNLVDPHSKLVTKTVWAKDLWQEICESAWKTGDPGVAFFDRIWETQPNPQLGYIQSTNPCGEEALENYGSCNLGSIDISKLAYTSSTYKGVKWESLKETIETAVRFLDDVVTVNTLPLPELRDINLRTRRIGLGVMGWADLLTKLGMTYDSEEAVRLAEDISKFITEVAWKASANLAEEKGAFPEYEHSALKTRGLPPVRNSNVTTIAPTGSISVIAGASSGIEPYFAIAWTRKALWKSGKNDSTGVGSGSVTLYECPMPLREELEEKVTNPESVIRQLIDRPQDKDNILDMSGIYPYKYSTTNDIHSMWHIKMQAAWQKHISNSISKTINLPNSATIEDIDKAYTLAWEMGCKAVTVYRDGSKSMQVLETGDTKKAKQDLPKVLFVKPEDLDIAAKIIGANKEDYIQDRRISREEAIEIAKSQLLKAEKERIEVAEEEASHYVLKDYDRPYTLPGVTEKIETPSGTLYVTINYDGNGNIIEVFSWLGKGGGTDLAYLEAICRFISIGLQHGLGIDIVLKCITGIKSEPFYFGGNLIKSIPDAIAYAIKKNRKSKGIMIESTTEETTSLVVNNSSQLNLNTIKSDRPACPECSSPLVMEEGCMKCYNCNYSRCG